MQNKNEGKALYRFPFMVQETRHFFAPRLRTIRSHPPWSEALAWPWGRRKALIGWRTIVSLSSFLF